MTVIRNRTAVKASLTFGEQQKPQAESKAGGQKFSQALETVSEREEKRRQRQHKGKEEEEGEAVAAPGAPARPTVGRVKSTLAENRQKELLKKLPPQPKKEVVVPRALAEAATDPRMVRPPLEQLVPPPPPGSLSEETPWMVMPDAGAPTLSTSLFTEDAGEPLPNQGDGSSLPLLNEADFDEVNMVTVPEEDTGGPATFADLEEESLLEGKVGSLEEHTSDLDEPSVDEDVFSGTAFARKRR
ncbi:MAG: hypothetical protein HY904_04110 [Deltaproteobacteria bacterium]|nr:hypothetical protein [Deltaproteobacteria bacterium]